MKQENPFPEFIALLRQGGFGTHADELDAAGAAGAARWGGASDLLKDLLKGDLLTVGHHVRRSRGGRRKRRGRPHGVESPGFRTNRRYGRGRNGAATIAANRVTDLSRRPLAASLAVLNLIGPGR